MLDRLCRRISLSMVRRAWRCAAPGRTLRGLLALWLACVSVGVPTAWRVSINACAVRPGQVCACSQVEQAAGSCCCHRPAALSTDRSCCAPDVRGEGPRRVKEYRYGFKPCDCGHGDAEGLIQNREPRSMAPPAFAAGPSRSDFLAQCTDVPAIGQRLPPPVPPPRFIPVRDVGVAALA